MRRINIYLSPPSCGGEYRLSFLDDHGLRHNMPVMRYMDLQKVEADWVQRGSHPKDRNIREVDMVFPAEHQYLPAEYRDDEATRLLRQACEEFITRRIKNPYGSPA